jgi:hypothetical protein
MLSPRWLSSAVHCLVLILLPCLPCKDPHLNPMLMDDC